VLLNLGNKYLTDKKYPDAERVYREVQKRFPEIAYGQYGIGRVQQEQGKHKEAVANFEQVLASYNRPQVYYRLGQSLQALNDKAKAVAAYEKALAFKSGLPKKLHEDAEEQLKHLKG
jgi:tetratricopeptide (TPR) repeat protein